MNQAQLLPAPVTYSHMDVLVAFWKELSIFPGEILWVLEYTVDCTQLLLETKGP